VLGWRDNPIFHFNKFRCHEARPVFFMTRPLHYLSLLCLTSLLVIGSTGCGGVSDNSQPVTPPPTVTLNGFVYGGTTPVVGSTIQLYAVGTSGYGSASTALFTSQAVTTDTTGAFSVTENLNCPTSSTLVYLTASGGHPGQSGASNPQLIEMAALGKCGELSASTSIDVTELTTVAAVWALAPFMSDSAHIGSSSTNSAGLSNAFVSAASLASVSSAGAAGTLPTDVTAPSAELNTLANLLASCVNTAGGVAGDTSACGKLFTAATPASGSPIPKDTVGAALSLALNPGVNVGGLYQLASTSTAFAPVLTAAPNDWTVTLAYENKALQTGNSYINMAVDASQDVWVSYGVVPNCKTCSTMNAVLEFGPDLSLLSPASGYTDLSLDGPSAFAIDLTGNLWLANTSSTTVTELSSAGTFIKTLTGGGLDAPIAVVVDPSNNIWVGNNGGLQGSPLYAGVSEFSNTGTALSPTGGYTAGGAGFFQNALAITPSGDAWVSAAYGLALLGPGGTPISPTSAYGFDVGGSLALDAKGDVWSELFFNAQGVDPRVTEYNSSGTEVSPAGGDLGGGQNPGWVVAVDGASNVWLINSDYSYGGASYPHVGALSEFKGATGGAITSATGYATAGTGGTNLAIDSSGNIWWAGVGTLYKCVGVAAPVMTPLSVATKSNKLGVLP
jgi:hypothetical protein